MRSDYIQKIEKELKNKLPGKEAQYKMAPEIRLKLPDSAYNAKAAVLILLFPKNNQLNTVFIKRNNDATPHSNQVSFPGGRFEDIDITLDQTALRESEEEIGVIKKDIRVIGSLTSLNIHVSNYVVSPFIGFIDYKPKFLKNPIEVQYTIETSLKTLTDPQIKKTTTMSYSGIKFQVPYYNIQDEMIWGATAMILSEFLEILIKIK